MSLRNKAAPYVVGSDDNRIEDVDNQRRQNLWLQVIVLLIEDALTPLPEKSHTASQRRLDIIESRNTIQDMNYHYYLICDLAGIDQEALRDHYMNNIEAIKQLDEEW